MTARRNQNLYRQPAQLKMGPTSATFVVIALISVLALLYLNQITKTSQFGYKVSALTAQVREIEAQKRDLAVEAGRLQSIQNAQTAAASHHMVATTQVSYVR
jgi:competence protein ComGC